MSRRKKSFHYGSIVLIVLSFFSLVSLLSYFTNWKHDQDQILQFQNLWEYLISDSVAQNLGGRLGALVSHFLFYQCIGVYSFMLVGYVLYYSLRRYSGRKGKFLSSFFYSLLLFILLASPLTSFFTSDYGLSWGGGYGRAMAGFLTKMLGLWGSGIVLVGAFLMYLYSFDIKVLSGIKAPKMLTRNLQNFWQQVRTPTFVTPSGAAVVSDSPTEESTMPEPELVTREPSEAEENASHSTPKNDIPDWIKIAAEEELSGRTETSADTPSKSDKNLASAQRVRQEEASRPNTTATDTSEATQKSTQIESIEGIHYEVPTNKSITDETDTSGINIEAPQEEIEIVVAPAEEVLDETAAETTKKAAADNPNLPYDPKAELARYKYPKLDLLEQYKSEQVALDKEAIRANIEMITDTLENFNISIDKQRTTATVGPTVTLYEIVPAKGVRISKIRNLEDDIALALAALGIRIIAPIPGKGTIGIEVPNRDRQMVGLRSILSSEKFAQSKHQLPLALGKRIDNQNVVIDLASMPHLLVAGATGQGKSVGINTILVSILYKLHPSQVKFVLIDPKKVELSVYRLIEKHFLAKLPDEEESIITDTKKVVATLNSLCIEMDHRYDLLKSAGARNLKEYNAKFISRKLNPKNGHKFLPLIVLVIDEFADLIMTAGKEVENPIARLAQLARAVGIHLIVATQRPDTKVITGTIKANFPARIAFKVSSQFDSRTILDSKGAEQLIGKGDMLLSTGGEVSRIQCAFVDTHEVEHIVEYIGEQMGYPTVYELPEYVPESDDLSGPDQDSLQKRDQLFEDCARMVVSTNKGSTSMLQRKFNLGYNRAGRIMDQLEAAGVVGPSTGGKAREVYISSDMDLDEILNNLP